MSKRKAPLGACPLVPEVEAREPSGSPCRGWPGQQRVAAATSRPWRDLCHVIPTRPLASSATGRAGVSRREAGGGASVGCCGPAGPSSWRLCLRGRAIMDAAHQKEGQAQDTAVHAPALRGSDSFPDVNFPATGLF